MHSWGIRSAGSAKGVFFGGAKNKNPGNRSSPETRFGRDASIYDLHEWQVGCRFLPLLLPTSTYRQSVGGRPANRQKN